MKSKRLPLKTLLAIIVLAVLGFGGYYYYQNYYSKTSSDSITPTATSGATVNQTETPEAQTGVVSGRLCYPSSFLPPGEVVAKDLDTDKTYTQDYPGSFAGGGSTYTFNLPEGTYHLRYQAHPSSEKPEIFTSGYFTECAKTMHTNECTPDSGHINIDVRVNAGEKVESVDLCDFYYNPTQMQSLDQSF